VSVTCYVAPRLTAEETARWRGFLATCPAAQYMQDPDWVEVERRGEGMRARRPYFFWCEQDGHVCLTAIGIRRGLPVPGRVFWEFDNGPNVHDPDVLDAWLGWLIERIEPETARLTLQPAHVLDEVGDQMETVLDAHGLLRRRKAGIWSTLLVDLTPPEDDILASFHRKTRKTLRQSADHGIVIREEDDPVGWSALCDLSAEMAARARVRPIDCSYVEAISRVWLDGGRRGTVLVARHDGNAIAAFILIMYNSVATGPVMPSTRRFGDLPASHLLSWEAMRLAKAHGCTHWDSGGYSLSVHPGEPVWGINEFKRGFAPKAAPLKLVSVHERIFSPLVVGSATTVRRLQMWRRLRAAGD